MAAKKILFVIKGGTEWMGGLHYIKSLIQSVSSYSKKQSLDIEVDLLVYTAAQKKLFADVEGSLGRIFIYEDDLAPQHLLNRAKWWSKRKLTKIFHPRLDEFIIKQGYDFVYPTLPRNNFSKYRFAEWIPDFQYRHFPDGSNKGEIEGRKQAFAFMCKNAPLLYLSSDHAKKDCEELFPDSQGKTEVMKFCVYMDALKFPDRLHKVLAEYNIPEKYFMVSNLLAPTKNLEVVIRAVSILKKRSISVSVVVTGDLHDYRNPEYKHSIFHLINELNVREEMIMLGLIPRVKQKQLLANSVAIIQPSRFEGWNTLVEEAKWLDKEIVLSDIPVHLEQEPAKGSFFKDNDPEDLAKKLEAIFLTARDREEIEAIQAAPSYNNNIEDFARHFIFTSLITTKS